MTVALASRDMDNDPTIGAGFRFHVGWVGANGDRPGVQPFTPAATGLPSRLRVAGGRAGTWDSVTQFEIWCDGQLAARKAVHTADAAYTNRGQVFNLSFADLADRREIRAGKPCELRMLTLSGEEPFSVAPQAGMLGPGSLGLLTLPGFPNLMNRYLAMDLTVDTVVLYQDRDLSGPSQSVGLGLHDIRQVTIGFSSMHVPTGWAVTLFQQEHFMGYRQTFTADTPYIGDVSPFRGGRVCVMVSALGGGVVVYSDRDFGGESQALLPGSYDMGQLTIGNDTLTSVRIPPGWAVTLYEHEHTRGRSKTFTADTAYVGDDFDDLTSSLEVHATGAGVVVYAERNFRGPNQTVVLGSDFRQLSEVGVTTIRSLTVPSGWAATLFEKDFQQGRSKTFAGDAVYVGDDFDNMAISVWSFWEPRQGPPLTPRVVVYSDENFSGDSQILFQGRYDVEELTVGAAAISSLRIPPGWTVTLYGTAGFQGRSKTFTADTPYVGNDFNDMTSSIVVGGTSH